MLTQNRLKELFSYNPLTGVFTRKVKLAYKSKIGEVVGCLTKAGYLTAQVNGKLYSLHRLAYLYMTGNWPDITDHINGVKNDNRWTNLRSCTQQQNTFNQKISSNNTSGVKGVCWEASRRKWRVSVSNRNVGRFDSLEEATIVAKRLQEEVQGVYAYSNRESLC
tara:strand:+ start:55 stop:546 length:492 start_codon:yes stop_codon:yes gene_type:complete